MSLSGFRTRKACTHDTHARTHSTDNTGTDTYRHARGQTHSIRPTTAGDELRACTLSMAARLATHAHARARTHAHTAHARAPACSSMNRQGSTQLRACLPAHTGLFLCEKGARVRACASPYLSVLRGSSVEPCVLVCVCVCVCVLSRECGNCARVRAGVHACLYTRAPAKCLRTCVCVCVCVRARARARHLQVAVLRVRDPPRAVVLRGIKKLFLYRI